MTDPVPSKDRLAHWREITDGRYQTLLASSAREMVDEIESARRRAEYWKAEHLAGNAEIDRLRTTLTGISTCSTCEACRGAALRALGEKS